MDTPVLGFLPSGRDEADNLGFLVYGDQADGCGATLGVDSGWCVEWRSAAHAWRGTWPGGDGICAFWL